MLGSLSIYVIVNLMSEAAHSIDVMRTFSILGYSLLPVVVLAAVAVFIDLRGAVGEPVALRPHIPPPHRPPQPTSRCRL